MCYDKNNFGIINRRRNRIWADREQGVEVPAVPVDIHPQEAEAVIASAEAADREGAVIAPAGRAALLEAAASEAADMAAWAA